MQLHVYWNDMWLKSKTNLVLQKHGSVYNFNKTHLNISRNAKMWNKLDVENRDIRAKPYVHAIYVCSFVLAKYNIHQVPNILGIIHNCK
jgi:hypothetical protein